MPKRPILPRSQEVGVRRSPGLNGARMCVRTRGGILRILRQNLLCQAPEARKVRILLLVQKLEDLAASELRVCTDFIAP